MIVTPRLQDQVDLDSADLQVGEGAVVGHFEDVCADGRRVLADAGQFAGAVAAQNADANHASVLGQAALDDLRQQVRINVASADDHRDVLIFNPGDLVEENRGQPGGASAFDDGLFDFEQFQDRARDLVFADSDDVVNVTSGDFDGAIASAFDGQAVGDGRLRGDLHILVRAQSRFQAGVILGLDADDAGLRAILLNRDGDAADQPAAADRNNYDVERDLFFEQFQADSPLSRDDGFVIESMDERHPLFRRDMSGVGERLVIIRAMQHDLAAQIARVRDLDQWRGSGHDDSRFNAESRRVIGHALRVVARAGGDDARTLLGLTQLQKLIERAALFEAPRHLQIFKLKISSAPAQTAERQ